MLEPCTVVHSWLLTKPGATEPPGHIDGGVQSSMAAPETCYGSGTTNEGIPSETVRYSSARQTDNGTLEGLHTFNNNRKTERLTSSTREDHSNAGGSRS